VHLLVEYPPEVPVAALVNSLKGMSARRLRQRYRVRTHHELLWSPSYFAALYGGAPRSIIRAYVEGQRRPD
jgi:putative transposase